ncbi:unnamed protein product [Aphanomyces euteiches]
MLLDLNVFTSVSETPTFQTHKGKLLSSDLDSQATEVTEVYNAVIEFYTACDDPLWKDPTASLRPNILFFARWPNGPKRQLCTVSNDIEWKSFLQQRILPDALHDQTRLEVDILLWTQKRPKRRFVVPDDGRSIRRRNSTIQVAIRQPVFLHEGKTKRSLRELRSGKNVHGSKTTVHTADFDEDELNPNLTLGDFRVMLLEKLHSGPEKARQMMRSIDQTRGGLYKSWGGGTKMELISDTRMLKQCINLAPIIGVVKTLTVAFGSGRLMEDCVVCAEGDSHTRFSQEEVSTPALADVPDSNRKASEDTKTAMSIAESLVQVIYSNTASPLYHGIHSRHAAFLANFYNQHQAKTAKLGNLLDVQDYVQLFEEFVFPDWEHRTAQKACGNGPLPAREQFPPREGELKPPPLQLKSATSTVAESLVELVQLRKSESESTSDKWLTDLRSVAKYAHENEVLSRHDIRQMVKLLMHERNSKVLINLSKTTLNENDKTDAEQFIAEYQSLLDLGFIVITDDI